MKTIKIRNILSECDLKDNYIALYDKNDKFNGFVEMDSDKQELLIGAFNDKELKAVVDELYLDDVVDIIEEMQREQYLHDLQWHENMNSLYTWDEGGFCDGFTK